MHSRTLNILNSRVSMHETLWIQKSAWSSSFWVWALAAAVKASQLYCMLSIIINTILVLSIIIATITIKIIAVYLNTTDGRYDPTIPGSVLLHERLNDYISENTGKFWKLYEIPCNYTQPQLDGSKCIPSEWFVHQLPQLTPQPIQSLTFIKYNCRKDPSNHCLCWNHIM